MLDFKFSNALMHFVRTDAPRGFFPKFVLSYLLAAIVIGGLSLIIMRPLIDFYVELFTVAASGQAEGNNEDVINEFVLDRVGGLGQSMGIMFLIMIPLYLATWATFEASIQRHYVRKEPFRLRLGNDEWRLMAVGIVVYLLLILVMILATIPLGIVAGIGIATENPTIAVVGATLGYLIFFGVIFWFLARVSAASALTIRDERVRIFESFRVTKGRFWPIFGAMLIFLLGFYILQSLIYGIGIFAILAQFSDLLSAGADPELADVMAKVQTPGVLGTIAVFMALLSFSYGLFMILVGGPGALAALNDPAQPFQGSDPTDVFS